MKSLAEFKRSLKIGDEYDIYNSFKQNSRRAKIVEINTLTFAFDHPNSGPSYVAFPKAVNVMFIMNPDETGFSILTTRFNLNEQHYLCFTKVNQKGESDNG